MKILNMLNTVYVLNPDYHLRNDGNRVLLYSKWRTDERGTGNWLSYIHPIQAGLLALFTYQRTLADALFYIARMFGSDIADAKMRIAGWLENKKPFYIVYHDKRIWMPSNVLVPYSGNEPFLELDPNSFMIGRKLDLTGRRLYEAPLSVTLMLTNRCRTHCRYCYADTVTQVSQPLPLGRILRLIEEAGRLELKQVGLIGGEVFLHPHWKEILRKTVECGVEPEYLSTKLPFTQERIDALRGTGYRGMLQVSLDAVDAEVLKASLRVGDDYLPAVLEGLRLLDGSGLPYQVATVLTASNCTVNVQMELFRFLTTLKHLAHWNVVPVSDSLMADPAEFARLKPSREEIGQVFAALGQLVRSDLPFQIHLVRDLLDARYRCAEGGSRNFEGKRCPALSSHFFILPDGKATVCEQLYWHPHFLIGDASRQGIKEIWQSQKVKSLYGSAWKEVREESACYACPVVSSCYSYNNRCWADIVKAYGKDKWGYPDPRCIRAGKPETPIGYV